MSYLLPRSVLLGAHVPDTVPAFIDNAFVDPGAAVRLPVHYPGTGAVVAEVAESDADMVDRAVRAARKAFDHGPWPRMTVDERQKILYRLQALMLEANDDLSRLECLHTGITQYSLGTRHIPRASYNFQFFAEYINHYSGRLYEQEDGYVTLIGRTPVGVAALLGPWNAPIALCTMKIAACIAFGNTCVFKPSEQTPLSLARFCEIVKEAGVPDGVINMVNGRGQVTGNALASHPGVDLISFTGGTKTGEAIMAAAAKGLRQVSLELGGKSASIVFADADVDYAIDGALLGIYNNNGQQCFAGSRVIVHASVADRFLERFVARSKAIRLGDPQNPATEIGPVASENHRRHILSFTDTAREEGAEILTGGRAWEPGGSGYFVEPTAVLVKDNASRLCQDEIFGPFAAIQTFEDDDEAIALANDSRFGLAAHLWTENLERAMRVGAEMRAGTVWTNTPTVRDLRSAFGGFKESGIGREGGQSCLHFYTEERTQILPRRRPQLKRFAPGA